MKNFIQYTPTEIVFGKDTENLTGEEVHKWGGSRVLIVYGGGSVVKSGLLKRVEDTLVEAGIVYMEFGGARPNPLMGHAVKGVSEAVEYEADFILAVGGGSAIDTAKAIAHGAANPEASLEDIWSGAFPLKKSLPIGVVLTIAAAGSETSDSAVLTNGHTGKKKGLSTDLNRPQFAIMNPELTYTLPKYQLACGIVDIMMHTLERYFTPVEGNQLTDRIAEALLKTVIENGVKAMENPFDYDSMSELMWSGSLSHNGLTGLGSKRMFVVHKFGHELSAEYDVAHGASLSAVWEAWARYVMLAKPERFAQYARNVWDIEEEDDVDAAIEGIEKTSAYFKSLGMPIRLYELVVPDTDKALGVVPDETLKLLADRTTAGGTIQIPGLQTLEEHDVYEIFRLANKETESEES